MVLLDDAFDDDSNGWGGPWQRFENGTYVWELPTGQRDSRASDRLIAIEGQIDAVVVSTSFEAEHVDSVGVECAYEQIGNSSRWYLLELTTTGARISKRPTGLAPAVVLAESSAVTLGAAATTMDVRCELAEAGYLLHMSIDGASVLEVVDPEPYGAGAPGLSVQAAIDGRSTVRFDYFRATVAT